ncbi:hypothetical protein IDG86_04265 [Pelagibacterales bacterium SAG-MED13]|nr:hypothetical protein [Pelagibacterales bacterium SAG-MED13]
MKIVLIILTIFLTNCKLNKIVNHHGVHNLEIKGKELIIAKSNINDVKKLLGPPSTESYFDNNVLIYIERKTTNSKLLKLGKKKLISNNVLMLEIDKRGLLVNKKFYDEEDINKIKFTKKTTSITSGKQSFIYNALSNIRNKINDPLGKKRGTLGR